MMMMMMMMILRIFFARALPQFSHTHNNILLLHGPCSVI